MLTSGNYFDYEDPWSCEFTIEDIATGLSKICRYNGHCKGFYSVAEHSVYVSMIVPPAYAFQALMHDAPEAFVGDMAGPLKQLLPDYKYYEKMAEDAVLSRFGIQGNLHPEVKKADLIMLLTEQKQLMRRPDDVWPCTAGLEPADITIVGMMPTEAEAFFLARYHHLLENSNDLIYSEV